MASIASKPSKGCYNCMKRRIVCDRTEPHCSKCRKKGLDCPGMGIRYRFNDGLAARGSLRGKTFDTPQAIAIPPLPDRLVWSVNNGSGAFTSHRLEQSPRSSMKDSATADAVDCGEASTDEEVIELPLLKPCLEMVDTKTRYLFGHFSNFVSPVMLLLDGLSNGYRHYILPLAASEPVIQRAVCVASAFHLSVQRPEMRLPAEAGRAAIITKLKEDAEKGQVFSVSTWATLVLLFVGELITGSKDILTSYKMLTSFMAAKQGAIDPCPLATFLEEQSGLIEFFTRPALSENDGVAKLLETSTPETGDAMLANPPVFVQRHFHEAYRQASAIYLLRAQSSLSTLDEQNIIVRVARFKTLLVEVDPTSAGAHTLVWPYWVAACESDLDDDRRFFRQRLEHIWKTTHYANVKVAIDALDDVWERRGETRWTAILPKIAMVIM